MDFTPLIMWLGFGMSAYAVIGNDVIQTLGTFLTSNENDIKWSVLWLYAAGIVTIVLTLGWFDPFDWYDYTRGVAYGRLDDFDMPQVYSWYYLLPPLVLIVITRFGIPVRDCDKIKYPFLSSLHDGNKYQKSGKLSLKHSNK
jgi:hypothetical protein